MAGAPDSTTPVDELLSVRDWLRYAVTRFEASGLAYGHGTENAVDEAAFLILAILNLPIDDAGPWLDCRLTRPERQRIHDTIEQRITSRKPSPYLVQQAWIGPHKFYVDERVIVPRSFIGELLVRDQLSQFLPAQNEISSILELCTGSGCLAILAALQFPDAEVVASDISPDALAVARTNVGNFGLEEHITLLQSDLFDAMPQRRFDLIIANPPYVTQAAVHAFPPEYRAEPQLAHLGGADGLDLVHRLLDQAGSFLTPGGAIIVEVGEAREALEAARPDLPFLWIDTETSEGEVFTLTAAELNAHGKKPAAKAGKRKPSPAGGRHD